MKDWIGNQNSIYKTLGSSAHSAEERENNDYYATDPIAIDKLLKIEKPNKNIWECACGEGHLSKRLEELGFKVLSTDLIDRGFGTVDASSDFLNGKYYTHTKFNGDILTNPPYKFAKEFVLTALDKVENGCKVYMFLKLQFLEGKDRFKTLFSVYPPKVIYVFCERVMCAKNGDFDRLKKSGGSAVAYAWYIWEKGYTGDTTIKWI